MNLNKYLIIELAKQIEHNDNLEIELRKYKNLVKSLIRRDNKLQ